MHIDDVKHQDHALSLLALGLCADRMPHGYVLAGPDGVGKAMLARRLAAAVLCEKPASVQRTSVISGQPMYHRDACGACQSCRLLAAGTHPDLHDVRRTLREFSSEDRVRRSRGVDLSVDVIREFLIDKSSEKSVMGGHKVFVVHESERMSTAAQNALLKTLEEPPPRTLIVLLTQSAGLLLPTTLSRCQVVHFHPLPEGFVVQHLLAEGHDQPSALFLARHSGGSIGLAQSLAADGVIPFKRYWLANLLTAAKGSHSAADTLPELVKSFDDMCKQVAEKFQERDTDVTPAEAQRDAARAVFALLCNLLRDALWVGSGADPHRVVNADQLDLVEQAAARWTRPQLLSRLAGVQKTESMLASNVNVPLAVEVLLNELTAA